MLDPGIWVALRGQRVAPGLCRRGWEGWTDNDAGWWAQSFGTNKAQTLH